MAFSPQQAYPGAFDPDADFIDGKYKNSSAPGVYDGTPLDNILFNQELAFWDALMLEAGLNYNNSADIPESSQLHQAMQQARQVEPLNNQWNGYFDPAHQEQLPSPDGYPADSGSGGTVYGADDEWSLGNFSSGAANTISVDADGAIFSVGIYQKFEYEAEQLALIDENTVPVFIKDQSGNKHFVNNSTNGVNVTKDTINNFIKVELTNAIFAELGITKVWRFFVTESVGSVIEVSYASLVGYIYKRLIDSRKYIDVTSSRASGVEYTNDTPCDIFISVTGSTSDNTLASSITVDGIVVALDTSRESEVDPHQTTISALIPSGSTYKWTSLSAGDTYTINELRL